MTHLPSHASAPLTHPIIFSGLPPMGTETLEDMRGGMPRAGRRRAIVWVAAGLLFAVPLVAMQFTDQVSWSLGDFAFAGILLFGSLGAFELAARRSRNWRYRAGAGVAIATAILLTWSNAAVGLTDSPADVVYFGVALFAIVGSVVARLRPPGMAVAMLATALMQASVGVGALLAGVVPPHNSAVLILGMTVFFTGLWLAAALLFRGAGTAAESSGAARSEGRVN